MPVQADKSSTIHSLYHLEHALAYVKKGRKALESLPVVITYLSLEEGQDLINLHSQSTIKN